jgi:hypothetical protein
MKLSKPGWLRHMVANEASGQSMRDDIKKAPLGTSFHNSVDMTPVKTKDDVRRRLSESSRKLSSLGVTAIGLFGGRLFIIHLIGPDGD